VREENTFKTLEMRLHFDFKIERSAETFEHACKACERKIRDAYELYNFIVKWG